MAARKNSLPPASLKRTDAERTADRTAVGAVVADLRAMRDELRTALKALPAPAARTAAQKRDALLLRSSILLMRSQLIAMGMAGATDRDTTADV